MHFSTVLSVLFAVTALAAPFNLNKRVLDVVIEVVTVTDIVYDDVVPTPAPAALPVNPPVAAPVVPTTTPTSTTAAYTPPAVVQVPTTAPAPVAPAPAAPAVVVAPAVSSPAVVPVQQAASPAVGGAPMTLVPDLDVTSPTYAAIALEHHNVHRANHSAQALTYNQTLATWAQAKAESCVWDETMPPGASGGMNIAQGTYLGPGNLSMVVTDMWYNGEVTLFPAYGVNDLDVSASSDFQKWGHFSQVVWGSSQSVGCGSASCGAGTSIGSGYFVACMYYPPGNFVGDFTQVGKPLGNPTVAVVGDQIVGL